jgi:hypothetical protein
MPVLAALAMWALADPASATTVTFTSTGAEQTFKVPGGVTTVHVLAIGAHGGDVTPAVGGFGAKATGDLPVTAGQLLYIEVAGNGSFSPTGWPVAGGFNGGGASSGPGGASGGGASDVRTRPVSAADSPASRLIVAGGGGGAGGPAAGGAAGEIGGGFPDLVRGGPGTATAGGTGGGFPAQGGGASGTLGQGGTGGPAGLGPGGGGGGGGLYGGGGGSGSRQVGSCGPPNYACGSEGPGGGGGGSSFFAATVTVTELVADTTAAPLVAITYEPPSNRFTLRRPTVDSAHAIALRARVPSGGTVRAVATTAGGRYGTVSAKARTAGTVTLRVKPTLLAKKLLARHGRLSVTVRVTFTPIGGKPRTTTAHVTVKARKTRGR